LVIEKNTRNALTSLLTEEGYSICPAETAGAGLEVLKKHKITHVVVLNAISMRISGARVLYLSEESSSWPSYINLL